MKNSVKEDKVIVCGVCHNVYQLLDKARRLILIQCQDDREDDFRRLGDGIFSQSAEDNVDHEVVECEKNQQQHLKSKLRSAASTINKDMNATPKRGLIRKGYNHGIAPPREKASIKNKANKQGSAVARILMCLEDDEILEKVRKILEKEGFEMHSMKVPSTAESPHKRHSFDACVVSENTRFKEDFSKWLRVKRVVRFSDAHLPIITLSSDLATKKSQSTGRSDLTWNPTGSDAALIMVVLKALSRFNGNNLGRVKSKLQSERNHGNGLRRPKNAVLGHTATKGTMPKQKASKKHDTHANCALRGSYRYNESTLFPFTLICGNNSSKDAPEQSAFCNLIVCHDIFDTQERMEIFLQPFVSCHPGMQVLLWNYPGQAFTEFSDEAVLNNEAHACHLDGLIRHLGREKTMQFDTGLPFYMLGYGSGAAIAALYAATYDQHHLRGLILVNGLSFVDPKYTSVMLQCRDVFSCCPDGRPDLPAYFYARYLFSPHYLNQVSASLALNLYTAVHNPISLRGRIRLCLGALRHVDVRLQLARLGKPVIYVHGKDSAIVKPDHVRALLDAGRDDRSVWTTGKSSIIVVSIDGGHDLFQEKKSNMSTLIEKILAGHYDVKEHFSSRIVDDCIDSDGVGGNVTSLKNNSLEVRFVSDVVDRQNLKPNIDEVSPKGLEKVTKAEVDAPLSSLYNHGILKFNKIKSHQQHSKHRLEEKRQTAQKNEVCVSVERSQQVTVDPNPKQPLYQQKQLRMKPTTFFSNNSAPAYPEVKEFMRWRLRINRDRLKKMHRSALCIQIAARCMIARSALLWLMFNGAALIVQRCYRGMIGRNMQWAKRRALLMAILMQRGLRIFLSRSTTNRKRKKLEVQLNVAKQWRGKSVRRAFSQFLIQTSRFVTKIQRFCRLVAARGAKNALWKARLSCVILQRACRGHLGRCKAREEHKKYLFSRSHSTGIELARQMLTQCRLHATKLQSEIALLNKEKSSYEEQIDDAVNEISKCEQGVQTLESQMHQLCLLELETAGILSGKTKDETREKKIRLDKHFSEALARISDRRDHLHRMQGKVEENERSRLGKHDELRKLERKLVVLLDAQQIELNNIRRFQEEKYGRLKHGHLFSENRDSNMILSDLAATEPRNWTGPTEEERQEGAQLMDSTEAMMKFGFMGMSMSYLSSLNLMKSMKKVAARDTKLASASCESPVPSKFSKNVATSSASTSSANWKVEDVLEWLSSLRLGQYRDAFQDGAVDGSFLVALTNEDLLNTLGVEHKLHRKKILLSIEQMRRDNRSSASSAALALSQVPAGASFAIGPDSGVGSVLNNPNSGIIGLPLRAEEQKGLQSLKNDSLRLCDIQPTVGSPHSSPPILDIEGVFSWVRHQKFEPLQNALDHIPNKIFDGINVRVQFVEAFGTVYVDAYDKIKFTMNKIDDFGNTMLHVAAQNGNIKFAEFLIQKGCNPNHQNKQGNTPGHFAIAYQFYHFATWFFDAGGGGGNDLILNSLGLGAYDGIALK